MRKIYISLTNVNKKVNKKKNVDIENLA